MTLTQAKQLQYPDIIHSNRMKNADGTCQRWTVNGNVKVWKRTPGRVQVPINQGLYSYRYMHEYDVSNYHLAKECSNGRTA